MPLVATCARFSFTSLFRSGQRLHSTYFFASSRLHNSHSLPRSFQRTTLRSLFSSMSANGEARPKRRASPVSAMERPKKQLKQENGVATPGDATPLNGSVYNIDPVEKDVGPVINAVAAAGDSPEWQATIEKVIKSVVSIHFCQTCSFDTDLSTSSQATGFVVDAERGYILTNRHVVCAGPFWGYCVFDNHEEVRDDILGQEYMLTYAVRCPTCLPRSCPRLRYPQIRPESHQVHGCNSLETAAGISKGRC